MKKSLWVLVVDDENSIANMLRSFLEMEGHKVTTAEDGEEGWQLFQSSKPDLVITDNDMPKMDGSDLTRNIKGISPATPVVIFTGIPAGPKIANAGADQIVRKPNFQDVLIFVAGYAAHP